MALALLATAMTALAQSNIRKVDFKNLEYKLSCGTADRASKIQVTNGEYRGPKGGLDVYLKVYEIRYGDLDNDEEEEAVILYSCGSGASYVYFRGLIYSIRRGRPVLITELEGGNKGDGGFYEVQIRNHQLVVERYQLRQAAGSPCCPESIEKVAYKLKDKKLIRVGRAFVRKLPKTTQE